MTIGPGPRGNKPSALVLGKSVGAGAKHFQSGGFGHAVEGRCQNRTGVIARFQGLQAVPGVTHRDQLIILRAQTMNLENFAQNKGESRGDSIHRQGAAAQVVESGDIALHQQRQYGVGPEIHEGEHIRGPVQRHLALAFVVGHHIIDCGNGDLRLSGHGLARQIHGGGGQFLRHRQALGGKKAQFRGRPEKDIIAAGKRDQIDGLQASFGRGEGNTAKRRQRSHADSHTSQLDNFATDRRMHRYCPRFPHIKELMREESGSAKPRRHPVASKLPEHQKR